MSLKSALTQNQSLRLGMTVQLRQSLHLLQLSAAELMDYVLEQSTVNPMLDISWRDSLKKPKSRKSSGAVSPNDMDAVRRQEFGCVPETLESVLIGQLRTIDADDTLRKTAVFMAGNLNEDGYLEMELDEVCTALQTDRRKAEASLKLLQSLEPVGVGARNLRECLLLQIERDPEADTLAAPVVLEYLQELGSGKLKRIAESLRVPLHAVIQALDYIKRLDPRPGLAFCVSAEKNIAPDAFVYADRNSLEIVLNDSLVPQVSLSGCYQSMLGANGSLEVKHFLREHMQSAKWLIRSLQQRNATLYRVIEAIVLAQRDFMKNGIAQLKPMNMKTIADDLGMHESTVSRTVRNKYLLTPQGLYELKFFFSSGIAAEQEHVSAESVKARIKQLIDSEDKRAPLSDRKIADLLTEEGVYIARRTVVKYREELRLLSSKFRSTAGRL
ncbi:RNA polymerase factor sigma-54 [Paenibacillus contaminans]|uniref:RNA polymerase sigma-54 factor n=1 Tax=Paenibacillus contaminans TaxID=450362 RepID=A0A329MR17_9BACL|nr:RNA polymerase factor sigma-54 [Paenibacillus contaminans]RAV21980.1 RNA polymerase sigma-54 factor [Paenibacillus contaminans]